MQGANTATSALPITRSSLPVFRHISRTALYLLLLSLPWMSLAGSELPSNTVPFASPFRSVDGFAVIVPVSINGIGPYPFLLDTGSTCTAVDRELAKALHLQTQGEGTATTIVRPEPVLVASALTVSIGLITERNVELLVRDLDGLRSLDPTVRGILGQNALKRANYLIDYQHRVLQFDPDGALLSMLEGQRISLTSIPSPDNPAYSVLAVSTRVVDAGARERVLILDSGTASLVLFSDPFAPALSVSQSSIKNASGDRRPVELRNVHLHVGGKDWNLVAHSLCFHGISPEVNGLLPTSLFTSLYISNSSSFVLFAPKRKHRSSHDKDLASFDRSKPPYTERSPGD